MFFINREGGQELGDDWRASANFKYTLWMDIYTKGSISECVYGSRKMSGVDE